MKIFVDSANLADIEDALKRGFVRGITTNPSILAREQRCDYRDHIRKIIELCQRYGPNIPLSVEVFTQDADEMLRQADSFMAVLGSIYPEISIKIPIGWNELAVIARLHCNGVRVNCTCCMSYNQAIMAAAAGARYVSLFYGRIRDMGYDAAPIVSQLHRTFTEWKVTAEIIVGSIRHIQDVNEAFQAGADIVTIPPKFFPAMVSHPKTNEAVNQFLTDFKAWMG